MPGTSCQSKRELNPEWQKWMARRRAIHAEIRRYKNTWSEHGQKWLDSQIRNCERRLENMEVNKPRKYLED